MHNHNKKNNSKSSFHQVMAATLTIGGISLLSPMLVSAQTAPLTPAGTIIKNTATGTYEDPNNPGVRINTTSNQVTATVAEVAGVTNVSAGLVDVNAGSVTTNDVVNYNFLITNVGNDVSAFNIPGTATVVGATQGTITVTAINGIVLTTPINVAAGGVATNNTTFMAAVNADTAYAAAVTAGTVPTFDGTLSPNQTIRVQVPVTVTATIAGNPVSVRLGDTGANDNSAGTQNQLDTAPVATDVYTINPTQGVAGLPVNGVREASAFTTIPLATAVNNVALATVLKTRTAYNAGTAALNDDTLTYRLDLRVEAGAPAGSTGITPSPLQPTAITLNNAAANRILISDAIPALTTLDTTFGSDPVTIGGVTWIRVYSTVATTTGPLAAGQNWQTGALPAGVTRIGYITAGPLAPGTTTVGDATGFQFRVITSGVTTLPATIANIAQVFGQTAGPVGGVTPPISATNPLVYDESGDQNPNNYEAGIAPAAITAPATSPLGIANPATDGTDANNNNTGTGAGGEDSIFNINPAGIILNGPPGQPGAIGPDGTTQTDFVNKSATDVPAGAAPGTTYAAATPTADPAPITFTNTVSNPAANTNPLDNVTLEPISPKLAAQAVNNIAAPTATQIEAFSLTNLANHAALPSSTVVKISFGGRTALYTYNGTDFTLTSSGPNAAGTGDTTPAPIIIPSLAVGNSQDYTVTVDLPPTALVTTGYSVPIVSYVNSNTGDSSTFKTTGTQLTQDNPFNIKMDRVYTGYLNLKKASRILQGTGLAVAGDQGSFAGTDAKTPAPGNIIEYQITYSNISTPSSGSGNVVLNANNIVITEDGAAAPNNWATFTLNMASQAVDATTGAVITYFNGVTATTTTDVNVTKYLDSIPTIAPSASGTFTFQRVVK